jgi:hypothetical protein
MKDIERDRFAPLAKLFARHPARQDRLLDVALPQLAARQADLLHGRDRLFERAIAKAVALDADGDTTCALASASQAQFEPCCRGRGEFASG